MRTHLVSVLGLSFAAALAAFGGCSAPVGSEGPREEVASQSASISLESPLVPLVYRAERVLGPCWHPPCGTWAVRPVNVEAPATVVSTLDFDPAGVKGAMVADIYRAERGDLLVRGAIGAPDRTRMHRFVVEEAYLGMPGVEPRHDGRYYAVRCADALCEEMTASVLDTMETQRIDAIDVRGAAKPFVDVAWLADRVKNHEAIVFGDVARVVWLDPDNPLRVLEARQVYLHLRDAAGSCVVPPTLCFAPMTPVWTRDAEGCLVFDGCMAPGECMHTDLLVACGEGYTRVTWPTNGPTCEGIACEPSFLTDGQPIPASDDPPQFP